MKNKCKPAKLVNTKTRQVVKLEDIPVAEVGAGSTGKTDAVSAQLAAEAPPKPVCDWLCVPHNREATHVNPDGSRCCAPGQSGIAVPCQVVWNGEGQAPLSYNPAFLVENAEQAAKFFQCGGVLLFTQDGHWVFGHSYTIAPALIKAGASPTTQVKIFLVIGDDSPRVNEQGHISVRKPAQIFQAAQVELLALLPPGFMRSQIIAPEKKLITPP